jgi:glycosyltransferase involved in cell wall biosynthesis
MRAFIQIRENYAMRPGGDTIHAQRTASALRELGVEAEVSGTPPRDPWRYDVIHVFNTHVSFRQVVRVRGVHAPVVLTPIYEDVSQYRLSRRRGISREAARIHDALDRRERALQSYVLAMASVIAPNTRAEASLIRADFPELSAPIEVVPNGADHLPLTGDPDRFCARFGLEPGRFVLCAARKEERKNQLRLIEACRDLELPLVLVGAEPPEFREYVDRCREVASASPAPVLFLEHVDDDQMLADAFAAARVHALPSWYESVGLSSLEAATAGCNVVASANAGAAEYLGDDAWYCEPDSVDSIRDAVSAAYAAPPRADLPGRVAEQFSWRRVAEATLSAYELAVNERKRGAKTRSAWSAPLPPEEYAEQVDEIVELQLEVMAHRDAQYASLRERADHLEGRSRRQEERATELEAETKRLRAELSAAQAELARVQESRLFRYTAPLRRAYARARGGAGPPPTATE